MPFPINYKPSAEEIKAEVLKHVLKVYPIGMKIFVPAKKLKGMESLILKQWGYMYIRQRDIVDFHTIEREDNTLIGLA